MSTIYAWARSLPNNPGLPKAMWNTRTRADFLQFVDVEVIKGQAMWEMNHSQANDFINNLTIQTAWHLPGVSDPLDRFVITGVLWAGCMDGAKAIRDTKVVIRDTPQGKIRFDELLRIQNV